MMVRSGEGFPFGKSERREEIARSKKSISDEAEMKTGRWIFSNSPLEFSWSSPFASYSLSFTPVIPEGSPSFRKYVESTLQEKKGMAVGIDFGGPGSDVFGGFTPGLFKKTLGVTLTDARSANTVKKDKQRHHQVFKEDLFDDRLYVALNEWLDGDKVDVIFERMIAGLKQIPNEPYTIAAVIDKWYGLLADGGSMFIEFPENMLPLLTTWKEEVEWESEGTIEVQLSDSACTFRLSRLPGAPERLPMLDPRTVRTITK